MEEEAWIQKNVIRQETNSIVQHAVYDILLQEKERLSVKDETRENIGDEVEEDEMYKLNKMSLDENKWRKRAF